MNKRALILHKRRPARRELGARCTPLFCLLLSIAAPLMAFVDPPQIAPTIPTAESSIQVSIRAGICDTFFTTGPEDRELEITGGVVILRMDGVTTTDQAQCIFVPDTYTYNIGRLAAGTYQLRIYIKQLQMPGQVDLVQTGSFTVRGSAIPLPTINSAGLLLLLASLGGVGLWAMSSRRP